MNKLRTIIRLYLEGVGLKPISAICHTSHYGDKLFTYPPRDSLRAVEVFVAILGCSLLTYVEATLSQNKEDFIISCENAFHYYGSVPKAIVLDNLKELSINNLHISERLF